MQIIWTDKGEVSDIKHKTNLNKEELQKNPQHLALETFRDSFQDKDNKVMTHL